jgi:hypothetical protein
MLHPLTPADEAALRHFDAPRPVNGDHGEHAASVPGLLARDLLVAHEDALLSVVVRRSPTAN